MKAIDFVLDLNLEERKELLAYLAYCEPIQELKARYECFQILKELEKTNPEAKEFVALELKRMYDDEDEEGEELTPQELKSEMELRGYV